MKSVIFDLDGVLADLIKGLAARDGYDEPTAWFINNIKDVAGDVLIFKSIENHVHSGLFRNLPTMPYHNEVKKLISALYNNGHQIKILTSCMDHEYSDIIANDKREWIKTHFADVYHCFKQIDVVKGSKLKINYVDKHEILIDDYTKTQQQFIEHGKGDQFILYKGFDDCVKQLKQKKFI